MIFTIAVAVAFVGIAAVLILAAMRPNQFRVQRSIAINAPPEKIYPMIGDLRAWTQWSPFEHKDRAMKRVYGSVTTGKGATYAWEGNRQVGAGHVVIADAVVPSRMTLKLTMTRPFKAQNIVDFTLTPAGNSTTVTWAMRGNVQYFAKVIHVFVNMDKMVGGEFESGLKNLKAAAEK